MATYKVQYQIKDTYEWEIEAPTADLARKWAKMQLNEGYSPHLEHPEAKAEFAFWSLGEVKVIEE